jgi:hypothetical protein
VRAFPPLLGARPWRWIDSAIWRDWETKERGPRFRSTNGEASIMAEGKMPRTIHIHADDVNSLMCKTLLAYCGGHYKYDFQADEDVKRSPNAKLVAGGLG